MNFDFFSSISISKSHNTEPLLFPVLPPHGVCWLPPSAFCRKSQPGPSCPHPSIAHCHTIILLKQQTYASASSSPATGIKYIFHTSTEASGGGNLFATPSHLSAGTNPKKFGFLAVFPDVVKDPLLSPAVALWAGERSLDLDLAVTSGSSHNGRHTWR